MGCLLRSGGFIGLRHSTNQGEIGRKRGSGNFYHYSGLNVLVVLKAVWQLLPPNQPVALLFDIDTVANSPADVLELRFTPSSESEQLRGLPSHLFINPQPGEDLIVVLPPIEPGTTFTAELEVQSDRSGAPTRIPIKIKHEI